MITIENEEDPVEKVDLYNFEDPKFENSRYVLTSPRSLEACSRLNVKPVELLYKPLTEFQEELLPQDVPLRTIYNIYDEQEQIRQRKLQLCREERTRVNKEDIQDKSSFGKHKMGSKGDQARNVTKGSLQRQRTAWAAGVGHQRMTKDELNKRAKGLHDESVKLRQELLSRKEGKPRRPVAKRPGSAQGSRLETSGTPRTRSKSVSEIYRKLPAKDQKILDLMRAKREGEKQRLEESERTRQLWEDERKRQEALRTVMENKRRKMLARKNQIQDTKKLQESSRRSRTEEHLRDQKEEEIFRRSKSAEQRLYRQLKSQELKLSEKKDKEVLRKSIQERNLQMQSRDEEDMKERVAQHTKSTLSQAQQRKDMNIMQQSLRKSVSNQQERNAFELRRRELEKDASVGVPPHHEYRWQEEGTQSVMELRHSKAEGNLANLLETRNQQLISSHLEEEKKQEKAKQVQQKLEAEMEAWRRNLLQHKKQVEKQAEVTAQVTKETRAQRVRQDRQTREQEQQRNLRKLTKEHDRWKRSLEESMHDKDRKVEEAQQQRERSIMQTRAMAQMSHMLRDKLRMKYETDTFDRKVLDAQLFARLESRPMSARRSTKAS